MLWFGAVRTVLRVTAILFVCSFLKARISRRPDADLWARAQWPKDFGRRKMAYGPNLVSHSSCTTACGVEWGSWHGQFIWNTIRGVTHMFQFPCFFIVGFHVLGTFLGIGNSTEFDEPGEKYRRQDFGKWSNLVRQHSLHVWWWSIFNGMLAQKLDLASKPSPQRPKSSLRFHSAW